METAVRGHEDIEDRVAVFVMDGFLASRDRAKDPDACIAKLRQQFQEIRDNPAPLKTWSGEDNSYRTWATRMCVQS